MQEKQVLSVYVQQILDKNEVQLQSRFFVEKSDLDVNGDFVDSYVIFDDHVLVVLTGHEKVAAIKGGKRLDVTFEFISIKTYEMEKVSELLLENFLSSGRLVALIEEEPVELCAFSMGQRNHFDRFCRIHTAIKKGDERIIETLMREKPQELFCPKCGTRYPQPERGICPKCTVRMSIFGRLLKSFLGYKKEVALVLILMIVNAGFSIMSPYISNKLLFDNVLTPGGSLYGQIGLIVAVLLLVKVVSTLLGMAFSYTVAGIMPRMVYDIKMNIFTAMQRLSVSFYTSKQTGNLMSRVNKDANNIYWFFVDGFPYAITNILMFVGILTVMLIMSPSLAMIAIILIPTILLSFKLMWKAFRKLWHRNWVFNSALTSFLSDALAGQRVIRSFAKEPTENARFSKISDEMSQNNKKLNDTEMTYFPLVYLFMFLGQIIVTAIGSVMIVKGQMQLGTLLTFIMYLGMLYQPLEFMSWFSNWWARCVDSAQRMFEVIDSKPEIVESDNPVGVNKLEGNIELKNVFFEYEPGRPIVKDINLKIRAGEFIGIVGKAGAGKSTMANLIARLYEVREGEILLDGHNIKDLKLSVLHQNVGVVSQEIYIFMGTIADNIRYAKPDASVEEVIAAAKSAAAHDFIVKLPNGYETRVGSGGQELSGGEKQRLSIARTILQNPKILIMDEATAAMDTETERNIQQSVDNLKKGRTTLAIAHRLSTLRDADYIAVVDEGKVVEYGTHKELIQQKGKFYNLHKIQTEAIKGIAIGG